MGHLVLGRLRWLGTVPTTAAGRAERLSEAKLISGVFVCFTPQVARAHAPGQDAALGALAGPLRGADADLGAASRCARLSASLRLLRAQRGPLHVSVSGFCTRGDF